MENIKTPIGVTLRDGFVIFQDVAIVEHGLKAPAQFFAVRSNKQTVFGGKLLTTIDINYEAGLISMCGFEHKDLYIPDFYVRKVSQMVAVLNQRFGTDWHIVDDSPNDFHWGEYRELEETIDLLNECLKLESHENSIF